MTEPPSSGVTPESLSSKLIDSLEASHVEIVDQSGMRYISLHMRPANNKYRRLRPNVLRHHRIPSLRDQENHPLEASPRQRRLERRDRRHTRLDAEMLHACRVAKDQGEGY